MDTKIGDKVKIVMPNWRGDVKTYRFIVTGLTEDEAFISPEVEGSDVMEQAFRVFIAQRKTSGFKLKVGIGDNARSYQLIGRES